MPYRVPKQDIIVLSSLLAFVAAFMFVRELPLLQDHPFVNFYIIGRIFVITACIACIIMAALETKLIFPGYPIGFYIIGLFFDAHGQYFFPNYWLAYIQITTLFAFIFTLDRKILAFVFAAGLILFDSVLFISSNDFINKGALSKDSFNLILLSTTLSTIVSFVGASVFLTEKMNRDQIYQRFIDLGKHMSFIVHDIKGMISGPSTYIDILSHKLSQGKITDHELQLMAYLKEDIDAIRDFVLEMNLLVSSHITDKKNPIKVSSVVKSIKKVFKSKIQNIEVNLIGDMTLMVKIDFLNRIIINSIINSCDAIHKNKIKDGKITICCKDNLLRISDNSGEQLDNDTLRKLNTPYSIFSSGPQGSGLGVLLIKDYINAVGGSFKFDNYNRGVDLIISFPKNIIL